jgi:hypothetical protein
MRQPNFLRADFQFRREDVYETWVVRSLLFALCSAWGRRRRRWVKSAVILFLFLRLKLS